MTPDKPENKYKNWMFTINSLEEDKLINPGSLSRIISNFSDCWVFQAERGEGTGRLHFQGCLKTKIRVRQQTLLNYFRKYTTSSKDKEPLIMEMITVDRMRGDFSEAKEYCTKEEGRVDGPWYASSIKDYDGGDLALFKKDENLYPWQDAMLNRLLTRGGPEIKPADSRTVIWIYDDYGNNGKSIFIKYLCYMLKNDVCKLPFGSAAQLRSAVISAGPKKIYFVDIPRQLRR